MQDIVPNSENSSINTRQSPNAGLCGEVLGMGEKCRKCGAEMEVIGRNRRELIEEVIEVHYRCPKCKYEIIIPEPAEEAPKVRNGGG